MIHNDHRERAQRRRRAGTAIVEFVVVIPLLALILVLTFFFGYAMTNQQHVWVADRYAAWRQVRTGQVPTDDQINHDFFADRAQNLATGRDNGSDRTERDYVDSVVSNDLSAGDVASDLVGRSPKGLGVQVQAEFPSSVQYWNRFAGAMRSRSSREGVEWRWRQVVCEDVVADRMLTQVDGMLNSLPAPTNGMGYFLRTLYRYGWSYHDAPYGTDANAN